MMNINSPELQELIHDVVYGIGPLALECDDFQSLPVDLRMSVLAEVEDLIHLEFGESEFLDVSIDQLDPIGIEPFGRSGNGVCPEHQESNPFNL